MPQNYLSAFRGPNLAAIDEAAYSNAILENDRNRIDQHNRQQDQQIEAQDLAISERQREAARGVLARNFALASQSPRPRDAARALIGSAEFQTAGKLINLPIDQFAVDDVTDTDESMRTQLQDWAQTLGASAAQQQRVQSTQVLEDGTIAMVTNDGQLVRTNERARNPMQVTDVGGAPSLVNRLNAQVTPLSTPDAENRAAADRAAATTTATTTAQADATRRNVQTDNERTLGVWQVARAGLVKALKGTDTGPFIGRLPAVTTGQQVAEGAIASVAPVLKQLFRSAGEGVFTDRDQQLLLDMVPQRTDTPDAAEAKLGMIDAIIQAKLSAGLTGSGGPNVGTIQDGYRFLGGDPSQPSSWQKVQ